MEEFDLGSGEEQSSPDTLAALHKALADATALEGTIEQLEADLKAAKQAVQSLKTGRIPDLMAELMMEDMTWNGWKVKVGDFVSGSLPSDPAKRMKAIEWLEANEGGGLIKTEVKVEFGKGDREAAQKAAEALDAMGWTPKVDSGVHAQTLQAFARERIRNGDPIDTEVLGLYTGRVAKFARAK